MAGGASLESEGFNARSRKGVTRGETRKEKCCAEEGYAEEKHETGQVKIMRKERERHIVIVKKN